MTVPRPDYPRPQFRRRDWLSLNGLWQCIINPDGRDRGQVKGRGSLRPIQVPFPPESRLSGIGHTDFIDTMVYHRTIDIPAGWAGRDVMLNMLGVDWQADIYVDGRWVDRHVGGSTAFAIDLAGHVSPGGSHSLVVEVSDPLRTRPLPAGKQSRERDSHGCFYTRVTGIWGSVWLEPVAPGGLDRVRLIPDLGGGRVLVRPRFAPGEGGHTLSISAAGESGSVAEVTAPVRPGVPVALDLPGARAWSPEDPHLYELELRVLDRSGQVIDRVASYCGLREVRCEDGWIVINGRPCYQRLVLDQGYFPDGVWTAPSADALRQDIELARQAGFNGARLHQKVFEPIYHYWADRLGYLTWAEGPSWGLDVNDAASGRDFLGEWAGIVEQCANHPSVIAWTPLNETDMQIVGEEQRRLVRDAYDLTHALDGTRPVNDASGWVHQATDLWTVHNYEQDPSVLDAALTPPPDVFRNAPAHEPPYEGQPYIIDEFGGIKSSGLEDDPGGNSQGEEGQGGWGYGDPPGNRDDFMRRLADLVAVVESKPFIAGFCYTQLTDVEQEVNGLFTAEREAKFPIDALRAIFAEGDGEATARARPSKGRGR